MTYASTASSLKQTVDDMSDTTKSTVTIKKYANRRLYNTATSTYVTLEDLAQMVKEGVEFNVYDAKTSEDITRSVLTQIIVEEEGKSGQQNLLPISFLRQLIGFYGDNMQWLVPKYLEQSMKTLAENSGPIGSAFQSTFGSMFPFGSTFEEMGKQNMAMFEQAMRMFTPFSTIDNGMPSTTQTTTTTVKEAKPVVTPVPEPETPKAAVKEMSRKEKVVPVAEAPASCCTAEKPTACECAAPKATTTTTADATPMPNVKSVMAALAPSADDMQQKIANLQKQLAELARNRG